MVRVAARACQLPSFVIPLESQAKLAAIELGVRFGFGASGLGHDRRRAERGRAGETSMDRPREPPCAADATRITGSSPVPRLSRMKALGAASALRRH
jgi:hypothetical protein